VRILDERGGAPSSAISAMGPPSRIHGAGVAGLQDATHAFATRSEFRRSGGETTDQQNTRPGGPSDGTPSWGGGGRREFLLPGVENSGQQNPRLPGRPQRDSFIGVAGVSIPNPPFRRLPRRLRAHARRRLRPAHDHALGHFVPIPSVQLLWVAVVTTCGGSSLSKTDRGKHPRGGPR
jgi:hypothetical protein